jgi:hypothetical protein
MMKACRSACSVLVLAVTLFWRTPMFRETDSGILMHRLIMNRTLGFSILDLLIIFAVALICVVIGIPLINKYSTQVRMAEALYEAERAQSMIDTYCAVSPSAVELSSALTGYVLHDLEYVKSLHMGGACAAPSITVATRNTGLSPDPTITLTGTRRSGSSMLVWNCSSSSSDSYVSESCRKYAKSD